MKALAKALALILIAMSATASMASSVGLNSYSEDFESQNPNSSIIGGGWRYFITVFEGQQAQFSYSGLAPNGPQISALALDQGGPAQGTQQLSIYSDYECCPGGFGHQSTSGLGTVRNSVFQERTLSSADVGTQWTFSFDAKLGNIEGASTAQAFLRVLDPSSGFSLTEEVTLESTMISSEWMRYSISMTLGDWANQILQFGFESVSGGFDGSGIFYDNIDFSPTAVPLPGALVFMLSGLVGVFAKRRA